MTGMGFIPAIPPISAYALGCRNFGHPESAPETLRLSPDNPGLAQRQTLPTRRGHCFTVAGCYLVLPHRF